MHSHLSFLIVLAFWLRHSLPPGPTGTIVGVNLHLTSSKSRVQCLQSFNAFATSMQAAVSSALKEESRGSSQ